MGFGKIIGIVLALFCIAICLWLCYFYYKRAIQRGTGPCVYFVNRQGYSSSPPPQMATANVITTGPGPGQGPGYSYPPQMAPNADFYQPGGQNYPMPMPQPQPQYQVVMAKTGSTTYVTQPPIANVTYNTSNQPSYNPNYVANQGFQQPQQTVYTYNDNPPPYPG